MHSVKLLLFARGAYFHSGMPIFTVKMGTRTMRAGGCPAVVAQWQSTGGSSQRCPGFDSRWLPAFSLSSIFAS